MKTLNDFKKETSNDAAEKVKGTKEKINEIIANAQGKLSGVSRNFAGIDENNLDTLQTAIRKYKDDVNGIINGIKEDANINGAVKGEVADAVKAFVVDTKALLAAYVSNLEQEAVEAGEYFAAYKQGATDIKADTGAGADTIRSNAQDIKIDIG